MNNIIIIFALFHGAASAQSLIFNQRYDDGVGWVIDARLINNTKRTIITNEIFLPWSWNYLELATWPLKDDSAPKRTTKRFEDLLASSLFLRPGKSMRGRIVLNDRFPFFQEQNAKYDMVVCYKYKYSQLVPDNKNIKEGCFIFDKRAS